MKKKYEDLYFEISKKFTKIDFKKPINQQLDSLEFVSFLMELESTYLLKIDIMQINLSSDIFINDLITE
jgi:acyl carrier protein